MRTSHFAVLAVSSLLTLSGCLTPSMGRKANEIMGGPHESYPLCARDAQTAHLVGQKYNGTSTEGWIIVDKPAPGEPARAGNFNGHRVDRPTN